jgi:hypothetical protein
VHQSDQGADAGPDIGMFEEPQEGRAGRVGIDEDRRIDAVDTRITMPALEQFALQRPGFKCFPRLASAPEP